MILYGACGWVRQKIYQNNEGTEVRNCTVMLRFIWVYKKGVWIWDEGVGGQAAKW